MRRTCIAALLALTALGAARPAAGKAKAKIYILPAGSVPAADMASITRALTAFYSVEIRRLPRIELPKKAYYRPRSRYRADKLLDHVESLKLPQDGRTILVVTAAPISITKGKIYDWGIIGYVAIGGEICAYSTYYAKRFTKDAAHAQQRVAKIAVHEFAHNLGLKHCPHRGCLMEDAQGTPLVFDRVHDFCPRCRAALDKLGWPAPTGHVIPWPRPEPGAGPTDAYLRQLRKRWQ